MSRPRNRVERLESRSKRELKEVLAEELGDTYGREITNSLRNDFMEACYEAIGPEQSMREKLKEHPEYSPSWQSWGTKRQLATALRLVLTDYVDRPQSQGITSLDKRTLAELVVAVRIAKENGGPPDPDSADDPSVDPVPSRCVPPESPFEDSLPAERFESYELYSWVVENRDGTDGEHGVYVLDCTPPVDGRERSRMRTLRRQANEKAEAGEPLSERERAARAVTEGERIYYVGYASDVPSRVRQHHNGRAAGGADFTNMFKPVSLVDVTWYDSESTARKHESIRADELTVPGESYAYWE